MALGPSSLGSMGKLYQRFVAEGDGMAKKKTKKKVAKKKATKKKARKK